MDQHLDYILKWFDSLDISPNVDKLKRQLSVISNWFKFNARATFIGVTGFGKSLVAIIAIHRYNIKFPKGTIIIVVPSIKLYKDWQEHIETYNLKNVQVYVVNTYTATYISTKEKWKCDFLIADEVHNYLGENGVQFNQTIKGTDFKMFLGLSATLTEEEIGVLESMNIPICDEVTISEARRFNYISNYVIYNYGIELDAIKAEHYKKLNDIHNSNFAKFQYFVDSNKNWELIRACTCGKDVVCKVGSDYKTAEEWRKWYSKSMHASDDPEHVWSPKNISKYAQLWNWAMVERKNFLYKNEDKLIVAKQIIEKLNVPTITFSENTDFADKLVNILGSRAKAFHSNIKTNVESIPTIEFRKNLKSAKMLAKKLDGKIQWNEEQKGYDIHILKAKKVSGKRLNSITITEFESGKINTICTARALDEGFNVEGIQCAIVCSANSKQRQAIQRMGRALRYIEGKTAKVFNLYIKGTQDETWLKRRQKGETNIRWIDSLDDLE